ncbi:MAG: hypothetical protein BJ554DRAFT_6789, partial [Olpidium bornovanus]
AGGGGGGGGTASCGAGGRRPRPVIKGIFEDAVDSKELIRKALNSTFESYGTSRASRASQTDETELVQFKELELILFDLQTDLQRTREVVTTNFKQMISDKAHDLYCRTKERLKELEQQHKQSIDLLRSSFRTQLADAVCEVAHKHMKYHEAKLEECKAAHNAHVCELNERIQSGKRELRKKEDEKEKMKHMLLRYHQLCREREVNDAELYNGFATGWSSEEGDLIARLTAQVYDREREKADLEARVAQLEAAMERNNSPVPPGAAGTSARSRKGAAAGAGSDGGAGTLLAAAPSIAESWAESDRSRAATAGAAAPFTRPPTAVDFESQESFAGELPPDAVRFRRNTAATVARASRRGSLAPSVCSKVLHGSGGGRRRSSAGLRLPGSGGGGMQPTEEEWLQQIVELEQEHEKQMAEQGEAYQAEIDALRCDLATLNQEWQEKMQLVTGSLHTLGEPKKRAKILNRQQAVLRYASFFFLTAAGAAAKPFSLPGAAAISDPETTPPPAAEGARLLSPVSGRRRSSAATARAAAATVSPAKVSSSSPPKSAEAAAPQAGLPRRLSVAFSPAAEAVPNGGDPVGRRSRRQETLSGQEEQPNLAAELTPLRRPAVAAPAT